MMSLDVYLTIENANVVSSSSGIFVREDGQTKEISREEWDDKFPNCEPIVPSIEVEDDTVYRANITHNLNTMAGEANIYEHLWRPDEVGISNAGELIEPLQAGLKRLKADPEYFEQFNPDNGWGDYEGLVSFVESYLKACMKYPSAEIYASR